MKVAGILMFVAAAVFAVALLLQSVSAGSPSNFYCGTWDGASVSANNLWKQVGNYQYYIGFGFLGDEHSCIGVWDTTTNAWISSLFCKYGDLRDCHVQSALSSNTYAYRYPSCPSGQQSNGDGCSSGCTSPNYLDSGYCSPYLTPMIFAQGTNVTIGWSFPSSGAVFHDAKIGIKDPFGAAAATISVPVSNPAGSQAFTLSQSAATGLYSISFIANYSDGHQYGSAYESHSQINSFVVVPATFVPPTPPTCTSFGYSAWTVCSLGQQTRTVISSSPVGCTGGSSVTSQSCLGGSGNSCNADSQCSSGLVCTSGVCSTPPPPTCTSFTYLSWSACAYGKQNRTVASSSPAGCTNGSPVTSQTCTGGSGSLCNTNSHCNSGLVCTGGTCQNPPTPNCTSFTYNAWSGCANGHQNRTVLSSLPSGCVGGNPITSQTCSGSIGNVCNQNSQCQSGLVCTNNICSSPTPTCTSFGYSNWSVCSHGSQTRTVLSSLPSGCVDGNKITTQSCLGNIGNGCDGNNQCTSGYCSPENTCQNPPSNACTQDSQCASGLSCVLGVCSDITPPATITNLHLIAVSQTSFSLGWNNPADADFSHVMVYLNNVNVMNTSLNNATFSSLTQNTTYTVSIYTVDFSGNTNTTAVSYTVTTTASSGGGGNGGGSGGGTGGTSGNGAYPSISRAVNVSEVTPFVNLNNESRVPMILETPEPQQALDLSLLLLVLISVLVLMLIILIVLVMGRRRRALRVKRMKSSNHSPR